MLYVCFVVCGVSGSGSVIIVCLCVYVCVSVCGPCGLCCGLCVCVCVCVCVCTHVQLVFLSIAVVL